jgi:hypothetical protein
MQLLNCAAPCLFHYLLLKTSHKSKEKWVKQTLKKGKKQWGKRDYDIPPLEINLQFSREDGEGVNLRLICLRRKKNLLKHL